MTELTTSCRNWESSIKLRLVVMVVMGGGVECGFLFRGEDVNGC